MSMTISGVDVVLRSFDRTRKLALDRVQLAVEQAANVTRDAAKDVVPVLTGRLKNSIQVWRIEKTATGAKATVGPKTNYDLFVEYGTSRMDAQPYMRPAAQTGQRYLKAALERLPNA